MKKKVFRLRESGEEPFVLFGISSHENDYRLTWAVNKITGATFRRGNPIIIQNKNQDRTLLFTLFKAAKSNNNPKMHLISNRCPDGFLIPELKNIDYFLQIFVVHANEYSDMVRDKIKTVEFVLTLFEISSEQRKKSWQLPHA